MSPILQRNPAISKLPRSSTHRKHHAVVLHSHQQPLNEAQGLQNQSCTHLEVASSPKGSFTPDTDWPTAMGTGFPETTAKEKEET